ncbi:FadR/GntR family transcriptional regulator [Streptomyces sp. NPDC056161]|uniref:FadR/GntR family transcriptional regulator n=1 Tax=Streptomyces sp. NPDC056161 TaxID=3345732 RepID=UPI0035DF38AC
MPPAAPSPTAPAPASSGLGAAVKRRLQHSNALEAYEVRASLERDAARYAATRRTDADLEQIRDALAMREMAWDVSGGDDVSAFVEADIKFHQAVALAAGNSVLAELYDQFSASLRMTLRSVVGAPLPEAVRRQTAEHTAIVRAIENGDAQAAEEAALAHLSAAMDALRELPD